jgi:hypothetical protein
VAVEIHSPAGLLRGHVVAGAGSLATTTRAARQGQVDHFGSPRLGDDVAGLEIAKHDLVGVQVSQGAGQLDAE